MNHLKTDTLHFYARCSFRVDSILHIVLTIVACPSVPQDSPHASPNTPRPGLELYPESLFIGNYITVLIHRSLISMLKNVLLTGTVTQ